VRIPRRIYEELLAHAREDAPNECCGLLGGRDGAPATTYRAPNAEASPLRYSIDGQDALRLMKEIEANGEERVAIYHSHTKSPAYPSQTDINLAFWGGDVSSRVLAEPGATYLIISLAEGEEPVRGFTIDEDAQVHEVELEIEE
jgi:proteasome lid subunit RPN8/RPN11